LVGWGAAIAAYLTPLVATLRAFLAAGAKGAAQAGDFRRVATLDMLPENGAPITVPILAERVDAWNRYPSQPIGGIFLRRTEDGKVLALNVRCPHLGCTVIYDSAKGVLHCPCHNAFFGLNGERLEANSQSPRDLDPLEVEIRDGSDIWVRFQHFRYGIADRVPE
jgi:Rieske Fe-S protein